MLDMAYLHIILQHYFIFYSFGLYLLMDDMDYMDNIS